jgi:hypothetical protein
MCSSVDPGRPEGKAGNPADWPGRRRFQLNVRVTRPPTIPDTTYRLAPALAVRLVGRSLVTLALVVVVLTPVGVLTGAGWVLPGAAALLGLVLAAGWAWYLARRAWAVRLSPQGYVVRLLRGVGVTAASWTQVEEVVATSPGGTRCLVLRLRDGRSTRLPMPALAADADAFALDVRRRVRDACTPGAPATP